MLISLPMAVEKVAELQSCRTIEVCGPVFGVCSVHRGAASVLCINAAARM